MKHIICALLLALGTSAQAQLAPAPNPAVKGKLFISVDDEARILLNGVQIHRAQTGESETPEIELKAGDRIIAKLKNTLGKGRFMMLFMSADRKQMISFRKTSFKILTDPEAVDFTAAEIATFRKQAKTVEGDFSKPYLLPFKSSSEWVWGEVDVSSIGCLITKEMFRPNPRP